MGGAKPASELLDSDHVASRRQFLAQDPDGYLLRIFEDLGHRTAPSSGRIVAGIIANLMEKADVQTLRREEMGIAGSAVHSRGSWRPV
jgi:hypothetical protein